MHYQRRLSSVFSWALSISLRRCAYLSSSGRYPACIGMEGFEPPSTRDLSRILAPTSSIPIMPRTNRGIVCKKRSLKHVHLHFGGMGRDGLEPTESEDTRFTVWPATNYGIPSLNRHRPVSNSFVRAMPCTIRSLFLHLFSSACRMMEYLTLSLNVPCLEFYSHQTYEKRLIPDPQFMRLIGDLDCMGEKLHLATEHFQQS